MARQIIVNIIGGTQNEGEDIIFVEIESTSPVHELKRRIGFQTGVDGDHLQLYDGTTLLADGNQTVEQLGISPDSFLAARVIAPPSTIARAAPGSANPSTRLGAAASSTQASGTGLDQSQQYEQLRQQYLANPAELAVLRQQAPPLADVVHDASKWQEMMHELQRRRMELEAQRQRDVALLEADPFDVEAQKRIEEMIRLQQVDDNLEQTREYHPEAFGRVHMLYIDVEVNGHRLKAFVDSGAQATLMSPDCAERCGIMRLLDTRFSGIAKGVGIAKILGRVHSAPIKIGTSYFPSSFTVMEGKDVDLLLGLDMLKRYQVCIDLGKGVLRIQGDEVPFLGEADIPKSEQDRQAEPTVDGPGGTVIGGITGAITKKEDLGSGTTIGHGDKHDSSESSEAAKESHSSDRSALKSTAIPDPTPSNPALPAAAITSSPSTTSASVPVSIGNSQASRNFPESDIAKLVDMGMAREEAVQALHLAGGNVEVAAGLMF